MRLSLLIFLLASFNAPSLFGQVERKPSPDASKKLPKDKTKSPDSFADRQTGDPNSCNYLFTNRFQIECDDPAFDAAGNARYKGYLTVQNQGSLPGRLVNVAGGSQHIEVNIPGALLQLGVSGMGSVCPPVALINLGGGPSYGPGQAVTYCFSLTVPPGTTTLDFLSRIKINTGVKGGVFCDARKTVTLPPCGCNLCNQWEIISANPVMLPLQSLPGDAALFRLQTDFTINNASPMQEVVAEVVSVRHEVNDPQCHTCTADHFRMGLFKKQTLSGLILPRTGWQNNGVASLSDNPSGSGLSSDGYANEMRWKSTLNTGVDLGARKQLWLIMALPQLSDLECCQSRFEVCVRYTFVDIDCRSCDTLVCYQFDSSKSKGRGKPNKGKGKNHKPGFGNF